MAIILLFSCIAPSERDGTCAETRFGLSAKRTSPFKSAGGQFSRLLAAEVCASAVVMVVMVDTPYPEIECKTTGYPLHLHVFPSLPLPCITVCHQFSIELYHSVICKADTVSYIPAHDIATYVSLIITRNKPSRGRRRGERVLVRAL